MSDAGIEEIMCHSCLLCLNIKSCVLAAWILCLSPQTEVQVRKRGGRVCGQACWSSNQFICQESCSVCMVPRECVLSVTLPQTPGETHHLWCPQGFSWIWPSYLWIWAIPLCCPNLPRSLEGPLNGGQAPCPYRIVPLHILDIQRESEQLFPWPPAFPFPSMIHSAWCSTSLCDVSSCWVACGPFVSALIGLPEALRAFCKVFTMPLLFQVDSIGLWVCRTETFLLCNSSKFSLSFHCLSGHFWSDLSVQRTSNGLTANQQPVHWKWPASTNGIPVDTANGSPMDIWWIAYCCCYYYIIYIKRATWMNWALDLRNTATTST